MRLTYLCGIFFLLMSGVISSSHKDPKELDAENLKRKDKEQNINGMEALSNDTVADDFKLIEDELRRTAATRERGLSEQEKAENELNQLRDAEKKAETARIERDESEAQIKRQNEIANREKNKDKIEQEDQEGRRKAARIKGITRDELNWSGLE